MSESKLKPTLPTSTPVPEIVGKVRLRHAVAKALYNLYGYKSRRL